MPGENSHLSQTLDLARYDPRDFPLGTLRQKTVELLSGLRSIRVVAPLLLHAQPLLEPAHVGEEGERGIGVGRVLHPVGVVPKTKRKKEKRNGTRRRRRRRREVAGDTGG